MKLADWKSVEKSFTNRQQDFRTSSALTETLLHLKQFILKESVNKNIKHIVVLTR